VSRSLKGGIFKGLLLFSLAVGFVMLGTLVVDVFRDGLPYLDWTLLSNPPSTDPDIAGAKPAILATIYMGVLLLLFAVPIGVLTAIYLEEYADKRRWYNRMLEINIQNLAAVPSIVYGILGLAFLVRGIGLGRVLLAGAMILTLLVLPTVIIASREAIRAVPPSIREGSLALGATEWQTIRGQVLPAAVPGILTGVILAISRAIGEAAPLLLLGAATFVTFNPEPFNPDTGWTALPVQIYQLAVRPQEDIREVAAAGIIVMLAVLLLMNSFAIWLRNRYEQRW
jgi:phosphate transport system permease protein